MLNGILLSGAVIAVVLLAGCNAASQMAGSPAAGFAADSPAEGAGSPELPGDGLAGEALASQSEPVGPGGDAPQGPTGTEEYRLNPEDVIEVSVFQVPDLSRTVEVNARGEISMPLIGAVEAGGKTASELEAEIAGRLGATYLQSPEVNVFVEEYNSQRVTVDGAVSSPGIYQVSGGHTLLRTIAQAGGLERVADPGGILVFRMKDGVRQAAVFDLDRIRDGSAPDPQLQGGDVVVVDESATRTAWRGFREVLGAAGFFRPVLF